jgi:WD40 repeat protein
VFVADNEIAVVTDNSVCLWRWETGDKPCSSVNAQDLLKQRSHNVTQSNKKAVNTYTLEPSVVMQNIVSQELDHSTYSHYTCATLSQDHQYIIVGASDSCIRVWDIEERRLVKEYLSHNGLVISPCFFHCDNRTVKFITANTKTHENDPVTFTVHLHSLFPQDPSKCHLYFPCSIFSEEIFQVLSNQNSISLPSYPHAHPVVASYASL